MSASASALTSVEAVQSALSVMTALSLTSYRFEQPGTLTDGASYDYLIIGGGTAGSIVANRLAANCSSCSIAVFEAGAEPPLESVLPGIFTVMPGMDYDFNFPAVTSSSYGQYLQDETVKFTAGKFLGGSSSIQHMIMVRGNRRDYERWATAAGDSAWDYDSLLPYFKRSEKMEDQEILDSEFGAYHGTTGNICMSRELNSENDPIIASFEELGYEYHLDLNANVTLGVSNPIYGISSDGIRQSTAESYLSSKFNYSNLAIFESTTVTKILFDDDKNAIGITALNSSNETVTITAVKEVIVAAGALKTPQLLMLSGIGPQSELEALDITVVSDLPVGQKFSDHVGVVVPFTLATSSDTTPPANPHVFPVPTTVAFKNLDSSIEYPDCQSINLLFPHDSAGLLQLCANAFKYKNDICDQIYAGNTGQGLMFSVVYILQPNSTGTVTISSTDISDNPVIDPGYFSDSTDLETLASCLLDISGLVNTTHFVDIGSKIVELDLEECSSLDMSTSEYWSCYGQAMSSTIWHPVATAPMGSVLDSSLKVKGVQNLRVVDAAAMPNVSSGNIMPAVVVLAEKAADLIIADM